jgi:hypothetical protein
VLLLLLLLGQQGTRLTPGASLPRHPAGLQLGPHFTPNAPCPNNCAGLLATQKAAVRALFDSCDFFAYSHYPNTPEALASSMLDLSAQSQQQILLSMLGYDIAPFASKGQLLALEFGWGGGVSDSGDVPATTGAQVASNAWRGIFGGYSRALDPWQQYRWAGPLQCWSKPIWLHSLRGPWHWAAPLRAGRPRGASCSKCCSRSIRARPPPPPPRPLPSPAGTTTSRCPRATG